MCNIYAVEMGFSSNSREEQSCFIIVKIFGGTANLRRQTQLQLQMNLINKHTLPIVFTHDVPQCVCKEAFSNFLKLHVFFRNHTGHGFQSLDLTALYCCVDPRFLKLYSDKGQRQTVNLGYEAVLESQLVCVQAILGCRLGPRNARMLQITICQGRWWQNVTSSEALKRFVALSLKQYAKYEGGLLKQKIQYPQCAFITVSFTHSTPKKSIEAAAIKGIQ